MAFEYHYIEGLDLMSKTIQEHKLVMQECEQRSFVMNRVGMKKDWRGCAPYEIPLELSFGGTITMERCLPSNPAKAAYEKLIVTEQGQISASLCIEERTLRKHKKIDKESYISLVGNQLDRISQKMKQYVDRGLLLSGSVDEITSNPSAIDGNPARTLPPGDSVVPGSLFVKCPKSFYRGDKFEIVSDTITTPLTVYVTSVNSAGSYIVLQTNEVDQSAAVPAVLAGYLLEDNPKLLPCGYTEQKACGMGFCSIDEALGFDGSTTYLGVDRDRSPVLRGDIYDLTESTSATIVKDLLQVFYRRAEDCSAENMELLVPYALFAILVQEFEYSKDRDGKDKDAVFGYRTIRFCTPEGEVRVTPIPKMREDKAYIIDWSTFMWLGDMSHKDPHSPSSQPSWYRERGCSYLYYKDIYLHGKLVNVMPCKNACVKLDPTKYLICE
jgi:hypothetical protein